MPLAVGALILAIAPPFMTPHLWVGLQMLFAGELRDPVDVLDLLIHGALLVVLALKLARMRQLGSVDTN